MPADRMCGPCRNFARSGCLFQDIIMSAVLRSRKKRHSRASGMLPLLRLSVPARPEGIGYRHHGGEYGVQDEAVCGDGVGGFSVGQEKGDGGHQHPTQTLTDLLTIRSLKGRLDNITIGLCGDLKFGRTVHSLIEALVRYENVKFVLISPEELRIPSYIREDVLKRNNVEFVEEERLEDALPDLDILYMTRVQKERFFNEEDYVRMKDFYVLDKQKMELAPKDMYVLHPLPRVNEISVGVDSDPRAAYFKQVQYGVYVRMALILTLLEVELPC